MSGTQDNNIVNCTKNGVGVQIELTSSLRKSLFKIISLIVKVEWMNQIGMIKCMILAKQLIRQLIKAS